MCFSLTETYLDLVAFIAKRMHPFLKHFFLYLELSIIFIFKTWHKIWIQSLESPTTLTKQEIRDEALVRGCWFQEAGNAHKFMLALLKLSTIINDWEPVFPPSFTDLFQSHKLTVRNGVNRAEKPRRSGSNF